MSMRFGGAEALPLGSRPRRPGATKAARRGATREVVRLLAATRHLSMRGCRLLGACDTTSVGGKDAPGCRRAVGCRLRDRVVAGEVALDGSDAHAQLSADLLVRPAVGGESACTFGTGIGGHAL